MPSKNILRGGTAWLFLFIIYFLVPIYSQSIPVTFKYNNKWRKANSIFLASALSDWSSNDPNYQLTDPDGDEVFTLTIDIDPNASSQFEYKFVVDGGWYKDPANPMDSGDPWYNSALKVSDPMITYLHPIDNTFKEYRSTITADIASSDTTFEASKWKVTINGVEVPNPFS